MRRGHRIPQRRRIFLGCEGESERGYGALLARLVEARHRRVHLDTRVLQPGSGDPLALVERAIELIRRGSDWQVPYAARAILLDQDKIGLVAERDARIPGLATAHRIRLIWQEPCHEALLLRHLVGCRDLRPPDARVAEAELEKRWPEYPKGMPAARLAAVLDESAVLRVAEVEPDLAAFLHDIEFGVD